MLLLLLNYVVLRALWEIDVLNDKIYDFRFSTFSIAAIFYDQNTKRTMPLTFLITQLCTIF